MPENQNDDQAKALIDALAPKLAEALLPQLKTQVEEQIQGIVAKNDELLEKLAKQKPDQMSQIEKLLAAADQQQKDRLNKGATFRKAGDPIRLKKSDARDVATYRAAKEEAAKQGVSLEIVPDD